MVELTKDELTYLLNLLKRRQLAASRGKRFIKNADPAQVERWEREIDLTTKLLRKLAQEAETPGKAMRPLPPDLETRLKSLETALAAMNQTLLAIHDRLTELTGKKWERATA